MEELANQAQQLAADVRAADANLGSAGDVLLELAGLLRGAYEMGGANGPALAQAAALGRGAVLALTNAVGAIERLRLRATALEAELDRRARG